jgi:hypothetical protein
MAADPIQAGIAVMNGLSLEMATEPDTSGFDIHFAPETAILHLFASRFRDQLQTQA